MQREKEIDPSKSASGRKVWTKFDPEGLTGDGVYVTADSSATVPTPPPAPAPPPPSSITGFPNALPKYADPIPYIAPTSVPNAPNSGIPALETPAPLQPFHANNAPGSPGDDPEGRSIYATVAGSIWGAENLSLLAVPGGGEAKLAQSGFEIANLTRGSGFGMFGIIKKVGTEDPSLLNPYLQVAGSPEFAAALNRYNKAAQVLGLTQSASVEEIKSALTTQTTFLKSWFKDAAVWNEDGAITLQGNPEGFYGAASARHELVHLGASLNGQVDGFSYSAVGHELTVSATTTPVGSSLMAGGAVTFGAGIGAGISYGAGYAGNLYEKYEQSHSQPPSH